MSFELFLARRFLFGHRFGVFRWVTTVIAIGGTALGVASLLVTLAVMDGFRTDIQEKILATQPHIVAQHPIGGVSPRNETDRETLLDTPRVIAAAPFLSGQALIQTSRRVTGVMVRGIEPAAEAQVVRMDNLLKQGQWDALGKNGAILGEELARAVDARVGERITLVAPQEDGGLIGFAPKQRQFQVVGIFRSGMYEYDANLVYLPLAGLQELFSAKGKISGYGIKLSEVDKAAETVKTLSARLGAQFWFRSWEDFNRPLFSAMRLERVVMFIILSLIILVSSFTIISNLLLLTMEKAKEIGILQAIGASPKQVGRIFLWNGLMLGGSGVGLGLTLGLSLCAILKRYSFISLPADVYYIDKLPVRLEIETVLSVLACALVLVFLSILYPARKAREMDPVQAIRYG